MHAHPPTPDPVFERAPAGTRLRDIWSRRPRDYWALWALALASLAINGLFLYEHWAAVAWARAQAPALAEAAAEVKAWRASSLEYTVHVDRTVPVLTTVPIDQVVSVPISATLPVDTQVEIPFSFAGFTQIIRLPVKARIPVQLSTQVPIKLTVPIRADVPVQFDVPLRLPVAGTTMDAALARLETALSQGSASLEAAGLLQVWQALGQAQP